MALADDFRTPSGAWAKFRLASSASFCTAAVCSVPKVSSMSRVNPRSWRTACSEPSLNWSGSLLDEVGGQLVDLPQNVVNPPQHNATLSGIAVVAKVSLHLLELG